jgi:hypothetical protein
MLLAPSISGLFKWRQFEPEVILLAGDRSAQSEGTLDSCCQQRRCRTSTTAWSKSTVIHMICKSQACESAPAPKVGLLRLQG